MASEDGDQVVPTSKKLFINHVDTYQGLNIGKYLAGCVVGASLDDVEEEEEEAEETEEVPLTGPKAGCYQIVGTLKDPEAKKPDFVKEIFQFETREQLFEQLIECDVIVYDINGAADQIDEAAWAVSEIHADMEHIDKQKMFVLISSVMTWARSKPLDPDDPEIPFTEDDYRRRKPHPNFREHLSCEKTVIKNGKTNKSKLITFVVASGITYGAGENIFHYLYKSAWHNAKELLCFGNGQNVLPTIHIRDLAGVIQNIADMKPKARYIVATDDSQTTLEEIVKGVSTSLATGAIKNVTKEDALLQNDIDQDQFDMLLANLRMDSVFVKENMRIKWASETGIIENLPKVVKEFRESRKLLPMRVCVLGPPAVGKTAICAELAKQYKLHHIKIKDVIDEAMNKLETSAARADKEDEEDDDGKAQDDKETLEAIRDTMENNNGRIDDTYVIKFFRDKLKSMPCQNQGFLLDGFPKNNEQAKELFAPDEDMEEEDDDEKVKFDKTIMPEAIILLDAPDEFLRNRIMNLSEAMVTGTHNDEEGLNRRLNAYRDLNQEDESVINYFDELEFFPEKLDVSKDKSKNNADTIEKIKKIIGEPRNYGPTAQEREEMRRASEETRLKKEAEEKAEKERAELEEAMQRRARQEEWAKNLEQVKKEEYELLEAQSIPLRNYLMKHVMPTLTKGLIECCKVRPDDSVDFLAEYLFQNNPQID